MPFAFKYQDSYKKEFMLNGKPKVYKFFQYDIL